MNRKEILSKIRKEDLVEYVQRLEKGRSADIGWGSFMALPVAILMLKVFIATGMAPGGVLIFTIIATVLAIQLFHKAISETLNWLMERQIKKQMKEDKALHDALQKELDDQDGE